jgi:hypothetical protein
VDYGCFIRVDIFDNISRGTILMLHLREIDMMEIWKGEVSELYLQWVRNVRMNKSRMLACIVLQCGYHYLSMFLTIYQPPDLITEPATWHFNTEGNIPRALRG